MIAVKYILNRILWVVTLLILTSQAWPQCGIKGSTACYKDWIVSPETHPLCGGYFLEPIPPFPGQKKIVLPNQPITVTAERGQFIPVGPSTLEGHVHLIQGNRQILADEAKIYRNSDSGKIENIEALGNVKIYEPGLSLKGNQASISMLEDKKILQCAEYRLYPRHAHGSASQITAFGKDKMILEEATYTTCNPFQNTWVLKAKKITLNKITGRGHSYHTRLYLNKIPIFYFPYFDFPIDDRRQTGFLNSHVGFTSLSGLEITTPFYWNLAPNYDATFTPRLLSKRGIDMIAQTRYISNLSSGNIQASILPDDRAYKKFRKEKLDFHPKISNNDPRVLALKRGNNTRRSLFAHQVTRFNPNLRSQFDFQTVSDDNYFVDLGANLRAANTTQLLRQGELVYADWYNNALLRVQGFQTLHPFDGPITIAPYRRLPQFHFQNVYPDLDCGLHWAFSGDYSHFTNKKDPITALRPTVGDRSYIRPSISYPLFAPGWFFKPRLQWNMTTYSLSRSRFAVERHYPKRPTLTVPLFDIDSGLIFERYMSVCRIPYVQTLEPRAYYLWVPYRNQNTLPNFDTALSGFDFNQLFRDNRFSGFDRIGDTHQLTLALTSRFLIDSTGAERLSATLGQIVYFKKRKVTLCNSKLNPHCIKQELPDYKRHVSNYVGAVRYHLQEPLTFNATGQWNPIKTRVDEVATWLQYQPDEFNVINLGYLYLRNNPVQLDPITGLPRKLKQAETSFAYTLNENWRLLSRIQYDLGFDRVNEVLAGLEYQGCCTALRFTVIRYLQPNDFIDGKRPYRHGFYIQFVFKGLTAIGNNNVSSVLTRSIPGYRWQRDQF